MKLNGSVVATIQSGSGYTISQTGQNSATINIQDNDIPVISIADATAVVEGIDDNAEFTISSSLLPKEPLVVNFVISGDVGFLPTGETLTTAQLSFVENSTTGNYTATLNIPIQDNQVTESNGVITVTLQPDTNSPATYSIDTLTTNQSAEVSVIDDESLPKFGIAGATAAVLEPDAARFRLWATPASSDPVTVRINVSQTGNVLGGTVGETTTIMPAGEASNLF